MPDFAMSYAALEEASNALNAAYGEFQRINANLNAMRAELEGGLLIGKAGGVTITMIEEAQKYLRGNMAIARQLNASVNATLRDMKGDVDPGMAARFDN
jgi:hypothetical protein